MRRFFDVDVSRYSSEHNFHVYVPSTLVNPKDNAVSFITGAHISQSDAFRKCVHNLIFWPDDHPVPQELSEQGHLFIMCGNPHLRYCQFFEENNIRNLPEKEEGRWMEQTFIAESALIGEGTVVFPGGYIGGDVTIGRNCYIGSGVRIIGTAKIGDDVIIRENTVIGADGLTTDRDDTGHIVKMPQFGGVVIGNNVTIGANSVIARGAIDDTVIEEETSIDNSTFISHNVIIGKRVLVVGETIMFGSSSAEDDSFISGNATIRNGVRIGKKAVVGMGAVVVKDVPDGETVKGNPAK